MTPPALILILSIIVSFQINFLGQALTVLEFQVIHGLFLDAMVYEIEIIPESNPTQCATTGIAEQDGNFITAFSLTNPTSTTLTMTTVVTQAVQICQMYDNIIGTSARNFEDHFENFNLNKEFLVICCGKLKFNFNPPLTPAPAVPT